MIDRRLRVAKDIVVQPLARRLDGRVPPMVLTLLAGVAGVGGGVAAGFGLQWSALSVWLLGRVFDGLDGAVARRSGRQSDLGGYLDLMGDTIGYAAVPIGIAVARDDQAVWIACAVLLAAFYVNTMSWTLLAAIAEKRGAGADRHDERTSVHMPPGLVEGAETIVFFAMMLAVPGRAAELFVIMAVLVVITIGQRVGWAVRHLA